MVQRGAFLASRIKLDSVNLVSIAAHPRRNLLDFSCSPLWAQLGGWTVRESRQMDFAESSFVYPTTAMVRAIELHRLCCVMLYSLRSIQGPVIAFVVGYIFRKNTVSGVEVCVVSVVLRRCRTTALKVTASYAVFRDLSCAQTKFNDKA